MSPSRRHQLVARAIPRLRRSRDLDTVERERGRIERWHLGLDRSLPTRLVPAFRARFSLATGRLGDAADGFAVHVVTPRGVRVTRTLYYLHGGGFLAPTDAVHVRYVCRLARALRARVVLPDYPLTPEHTWRDSHRVLADDLARWSARGPVVLAGDSAGGNIALSLAVTLRDRGDRGDRGDRRGPVPERLLLVSPWVDLSESTPRTADLDAVDPWLSLGKLRAYAAWWTGSGDPEELSRPEVSPALADLDGLPPTLMLCGTRDLLQPGCRALADRARTSSWSLTYVEQPDLIHVYPLLPGVPEARRARRQSLAFLR